MGELFRAKLVEDVQIEESSFVSEFDKGVKSRVGHGLKLHRTGKRVGSLGKCGGAKIGQYVSVSIKMESLSIFNREEVKEKTYGALGLSRKM